MVCFSCQGISKSVFTPLDFSLSITLVFRGRRFEVKSLDIEAHNLSENFFLRYRLVTLMQAIIASDSEETEIEERNINYFVDAYIARFSAGYEKKNLHHRLIFDPDDSDVDELGNTSQKRHLRTVHRSDVMGIFASQARVDPQRPT
jgi:hypothetical protein